MFDDLKKDLEKIYYKKRNKKVYEKINSQIENTAKNNNVKYFTQMDMYIHRFICVLVHMNI